MKKIFQGILIGLGKIIPGVSGSVIAISLGVYEQAIDSISHFFNDIKKNTSFLLRIGLGILISIVFASKIIIGLLNSYYLPTILFFIGLIMGGIKDIVTETRNRYTYITIISFIIMIIISFFSSNNYIEFDNYWSQFVFYILVGIIDAVSMIIPGISGTALLMMIGCYSTIMKILGELTNISMTISNLPILLPFMIGMIIGVIITIKLVNYLFAKQYHQTYNAVLGFLFASIFYMFVSTIKCSYNLYQVFIGMLLLVLGYLMAKKINRI